MRRFIRRLLMGGALVWGVKALQDKRREWSTRPSSEIREEVLSRLPDSMDADNKQKVADKVVEAVKGGSGDRDTWTPASPPAGTTTPPPETPMAEGPEGRSTPTDTRGITTPVPPVTEPGA